MKKAIIVTLCAVTVMGRVATAQQSAPREPGTIETETLEIESAKGLGLLESGASAGGYSMATLQSQMSTNIFSKTRSTFRNDFRFLKGADPVLKGSCALKTEGRSLLNLDFSKNAQAYLCSIDNQSDAQFAMEVDLPQFTNSSVSLGFMSLGTSSAKEDAEQQAVLKARLLYRGTVYDAAPTGFAKASPFSHRVVQGYIISRNGNPVGGIDFDVNSNLSRRGSIAVPVTDAEGREAVLFMALVLNAMPDLYAAATRDQVLH